MSFVKTQARLGKRTMEELIQMQREIIDNPKSKEGTSGIWIYNGKARKKLDDIAWAITNKLGRINSEDI